VKAGELVSEVVIVDTRLVGMAKGESRDEGFWGSPLATVYCNCEI